MLKPAQLYSDELKKKFAEIAYDERFMFYNGCSYSDEYKPTDSTWNVHEFVSLQDEHVVGYIKYSIARDTYNVSGLGVVNFSFKPNYTFSKDLHLVLKNIFEKYGFNKISFRCVVGNPIESSYDKICFKYGGRIVGLHEKHSRMIDGLYYDCKDYEILKENYFKLVK